MQIVRLIHMQNSTITQNGSNRNLLRVNASDIYLYIRIVHIRINFALGLSVSESVLVK